MSSPAPAVAPTRATAPGPADAIALTRHAHTGTPATVPDPEGAKSTTQAARQSGEAYGQSGEACHRSGEPVGTWGSGRASYRGDGAPPPGPVPAAPPVAAPRTTYGVDHPGAVTGTREFRALLDPTVELARHLFQPPTRYYKTGVVLLAWLAGHQSHFTMVGGLQSARSLPHLARTYELADDLGLFPDPALAEARMASLLGVYGVDP
ncbi:DUF993 family protein [Streptomyces sp. NPDC051018]|uniref:DUF993 family protein n=1 Tax=Streptomyces sp. NPDC051018 TaxID=3365639 RepID=UPI0037A24AC5